MGELHTIYSLKEFIQLLDTVQEFKFYGAGYYLDFTLNELRKLNEAYCGKISCIMVSDRIGNAEKRGDIPIIEYRQADLKRGDYVLLTLGHRYTNEVCNLLKDTGAHIIEINFNMFQELPYREVKESIQPFIDGFPSCCLNLNSPTVTDKIFAWTCWWQGEEQAPDMVKACIRSQRKYLPADVDHIVITEENYRDYISLPEYVTEKVAAGDITLTTLSDMIRAALLYKYGGFWMDATLMVLEPLDKEILYYPLYTRNIPETQYCTRAMWADWFLYARPGHQLFQFLSEGFFYYYSKYDRIKYYFTVDYIIAIACNAFREIEEQLQAVPYNNEKAGELGKHLLKKYDRESYRKYTEGSSIQKLTYKVDCMEISGTIYEYLLNMNA